MKNKRLFKYCTKCKTLWTVRHFYKDRTKWDGLRAHCKYCSYKYNKEWLAKKKKNGAIV